MSSFPLSRTYDVTVEDGRVTMRRRRRVSAFDVWLGAAIVLVVGTPVAATLSAPAGALVAIVAGLVLMASSFVSAERRAMGRHVVLVPNDLTLRTPRGERAGYREAPAPLPPRLVVDGDERPDEVVLGVLVLERSLKGGVLHVVSIVTSERVVLVDDFERRERAAELCAALRRALRQPARSHAARGEPSMSGGQTATTLVLLLLAVELFSVVLVPVAVLGFEERHLPPSELLFRSAVAGAALVLADVLLTRVSLRAMRDTGPLYLAEMKELAARLEREGPARRGEEEGEEEARNELDG